MLVIAILALRSPRDHVSGASGTQTVVRTVEPSAKSSGSASSSSSSEQSESGSGSPSRSNRRSSSSNVGDPKSVPLVVLNHTTTSGLAREAAQRFESGGWKVTDYSNFGNDILSTCAYYDPSVPGAKQAAKALQQQYPTIKRVTEKFDALPAGPVVVVLTSDYQSG